MSSDGKTSFLEEVIAETPGGDRLRNCMQCGSCGGSCPLGEYMDHSPRALFAMIDAGDREGVLNSNMPWLCVSCYACTTRCPRQVPITDLVYAIKRMALAEGKAKGELAPVLAKKFTNFIDNFGRTYELGLALGYHALHRPMAMAKMGPMGTKMFLKGRLAILPSKIKRKDQLQAIIRKARELGGEK